MMKVLIEYAKSPSVPALGLFYSILERGIRTLKRAE